MSMALTVVVHETEAPALYAAAAAAVAAQRGGWRLLHLPARFDTARHADAVQHVLAGGGLGPSGLVWYERLTGRQAQPAAPVEAIVRAGREDDIVVPLHPAFLDEAGDADRLFRQARRAGVEVERIEAGFDGVSFYERSAPETPLAFRDRFGRVTLRPCCPAPAQAVLLIGLIGTEGDHRNVYPAALAALADAADALKVELDIRFIDPRGLAEAAAARLAGGLDGFLLPGGSDMANVAGQIEAALAGLSGKLPTAGLCLGMQTMATAFSWRVLGRGAANLAEADPDARIKTFVAMAGQCDAEGRRLPEHRTGEQAMRVKPGSELAALLPPEMNVRYNHRFRLSPDLLPVLERAGLRIAAEGLGGAVADAIEADGHPFYKGMQGHPELGSGASGPHPLLVAFLAAALARSTDPDD